MIDRSKLRIDVERLNEINDFLLKDDNPLVTDFLKVIEKHGGIDEINRKAEDARKLENLMARLEEKKSPYVKDLVWLQEQRDNNAGGRSSSANRRASAESGFCETPVLLGYDEANPLQGSVEYGVLPISIHATGRSAAGYYRATQGLGGVLPGAPSLF